MLSGRPLWKVCAAGGIAAASIGGLTIARGWPSANAARELPPVAQGNSPAPLGRFGELTPSEMSLQNEAVARLTSGCMQRAGFDYPAGWAVVKFVPDRYGHLDPTVVEQYGYGLPPADEDPTVPTGKEPEAYLQALVGPDVLSGKVQGIKGCLGEATEMLLGESDEYFSSLREVQAIDTKAMRDALADPRYDDAQRLWSACMHDNGYQASSFGEVIDRFSRDEGAPASAAELAAANIDLSCRDKTGVNDLFESIAHAYQAAYMRDNPAIVATYNRLLDEAQERATGVVHSND
jgi:hypothetical protein